MRRLRLGMIGCGGIASVHAERLKILENVELVAFSDLIEEKAKSFSQMYGGGTAYSDWRNMLKREKLDVAFICIPPFAHTDEVIQAAERGIHVFIEKPIALDMILANKMVKAVEKNGIRSQVGYCCRFGYAIELAKKLIEKKETGEPGLITGWYWCHFLGAGWLRNKEKSGGQIVEQATHLYDAFRYLCGEVDEVYGMMNRKFWVDIPDVTIEDVNSSTFKFKSGAIGQIAATTWGVASQWWFRWLMAAKNYTLYSEDNNTLSLYSTTKPGSTKTTSETRDVKLLEDRDLINSVLEDRQTKIPIQEGAKTLEFTLAVKKAMTIGRSVKLPLS